MTATGSLNRRASARTPSVSYRRGNWASIAEKSRFSPFRRGEARKPGLSISRPVESTGQVTVFRSNQPAAAAFLYTAFAIRLPASSSGPQNQASRAISSNSSRCALKIGRFWRILATIRAAETTPTPASGLGLGLPDANFSPWRFRTVLTLSRVVLSRRAVSEADTPLLRRLRTRISSSPEIGTRFEGGLGRFGVARRVQRRRSSARNRS
jgi:hypothetical protein